jgi:hypothetical protein
MIFHASIKPRSTKREQKNENMDPGTILFLKKPNLKSAVNKLYPKTMKASSLTKLANLDLKKYLSL